jgi:hypothetical protein
MTLDLVEGHSKRLRSLARERPAVSTAGLMAITVKSREHHLGQLGERRTPVGLRHQLPGSGRQSPPQHLSRREAKLAAKASGKGRRVLKADAQSHLDHPRPAAAWREERPKSAAQARDPDQLPWRQPGLLEHHTVEMELGESGNRRKVFQGQGLVEMTIDVSC